MPASEPAPPILILLVGDELLSGRRADTNGAWLAGVLHERGVTPHALETVPDDIVRIERAIRRVAGQAGLVVLSGGLGPTVDDITRDALAAAAGTTLVHDEAAWETVAACYAARGREPNDAARRQALVPRGARWLPNPLGTAPGIEVAVDGTRVIALPGVPREWRAMCTEHVLPHVVGDASVTTTSLWVAGLPEAEIVGRLEGLDALEHVTLASYPHDGEVELRFRAAGEDAHARAEAAHAAAALRLGPDGFEPPVGGRIQHHVVGQLSADGLRLATAESITGGLIAHMLTSVPGASAVFPAGWVVYETEQKTAQLGVPAALIEDHGVVSEAVAIALAEAARERADADVALATTGTAGPGPLIQPGHEPVPPGRVHAALALRGRPARAATWSLPFERTLTQRHAAVRALDLLRRALAESALSPGTG